jgi:glucokinase
MPCIGVLGPGTGLGVSGGFPTVDGFVTLGSEGGHVNFAPGDEREFAILQTAWREWTHVSNERLISGPGMEIIHRALAERNGVPGAARDSPRSWPRALTDKDPLCLEVLECFCGMLGGAAANLAVTLGAFGGIFIGGGIVPRMGEWFASRRSARASRPRAASPATCRHPDLRDHHAAPAFDGVATSCPSTCADAAAPTR